MNTLHVTSTADGTGKTAIGIALASLAQDRGATVGYMKPRGTRLQSATGKTRDEDPMLARDILGLDADVHELEPVVYSPTFIQQALRGRENPDELRERIREGFEAVAADTDLVVVEGAGRPWTGSIVDLDEAAVANLLDTRVLLTHRYTKPGDADDVLDAADRFGDRLEGVLYNAVADADFAPLTEDVMPFLDGRDVDSLGAIPRDPALAGVTVADLADGLGAEVVTGEAALEGLIERLSVGAMGANSALEAFRRTRNAVVVTGGDRSDVQSSALEASGVEALLLTGGFRPSQAIIGKAEERNVPILKVQTDTRTTVDRAEDVIHSGQTRSAETVSRMADLLEENVDVDALLDLE